MATTNRLGLKISDTQPSQTSQDYEQKHSSSVDIATSPCHLCLCLCLYLVFAPHQIWSPARLLLVCCCNQHTQHRRPDLSIRAKIRLATFSHSNHPNFSLRWHHKFFDAFPHTNCTQTPTYDGAAGLRIARFHTRQRCCGAVIHSQSPDGPSTFWPNTIDLASLTPTSASSSSSIGQSFSHRRRRSSASNVPSNLNLHGEDSDSRTSPRSAQPLPPIPGTPNPGSPNNPMSLSRSPSPRPGGGWSSPGLANPYATVSGRSSPAKTYGLNAGTNTVTWESAKAKSNGVNGYPSFSTQGPGFFNRHMRTLSASLPRFNTGPEKTYAEKEKLGRGRWMPRDGTKLAKLRILILETSRKAKIRLLIVTAFIFMIILFYMTRKVSPTPYQAEHC